MNHSSCMVKILIIATGLKENGWKIKYYGEAEIIHYKGASSKKQKSRLLYEFYNSMQIFYNKHYQKEYPWIINIVTYTGIWTMYRLKLILNNSKLKKKTIVTLIYITKEYIYL